MSTGMGMIIRTIMTIRTDMITGTHTVMGITTITTTMINSALRTSRALQ